MASRRLRIFVPFRRSPCLNWSMLPLSLLSVPLWCCTEFCWSLSQLCAKHYNQVDWNLGSWAWYGRRNFLTANTGFDCLCGMALSSVAKRRVFQQPPSLSGSILTPSSIWCRSLSPQINTQTLWNFLILLPAWMPCSTVCRIQISVRLIASWFYFSHRQWLTDSSWVHITKKLK